MFNSNIKIFENYKTSLNSTLFGKEKITKENFKNEFCQKKEKQIIERRKKMMRDIYTKMFSNRNIIQNNVKQNQNILNNDMEIEEDNNKLNNDIYDKKNKIESIQDYLNKEKDLYNELGEEFIYRIIDDRNISFCPICGYPVIIIDKNLSNKNNSEYLLIACVNSCFQFELSENVFNKYSMDNIMDLYSQALKNENECHHNDISPITSGDDGVIFSCITCLFEQFQ